MCGGHASVRLRRISVFVVHGISCGFEAESKGIHYVLKHPLPLQQWLLKHKMSLLNVIDCFLGWRAHDQPFLKTFIMNRRLKNELC